MHVEWEPIYVGALVTLTQLGVQRIASYVDKDGYRILVSANGSIYQKVRIGWGVPMLYLGYLEEWEANAECDIIERHNFLVGKTKTYIDFGLVRGETIGEMVFQYKHFCQYYPKPELMLK